MVAFSNAMPRPEQFDDLQAQIEAGTAGTEAEGIAGRIRPGEAKSAPPMRLAQSGADRRVFPRREISLRVGGRRLDHSVDARREPALNLTLGDVSVGGASATSQTRLAVGERVAVFFPPEAGSRGWDAYGRVLRCCDESGKVGYRVAVEFDPMQAA